MTKLVEIMLSKKENFPKLLLLLVIAMVVFSTTFAPSLLLADNNSQEEPPPLKIAIKEIEPFVFIDGDKYSGFSIDIWREIALIADIPYEYITVETVTDQIEAVANEQADAGIAAISMTAEREEVLDFSYPYFDSGLLIMTSSSSTSQLATMIQIIFSKAFLSSFAVLMVLILIVGHIIWLFERRHNPDFPKSYFSGVWEGVWWSAVTVTTVGYGDRTPRAMAGRLLGLFWMFAGLLVITNFIATVTSELTVNQLQSSINGVKELPGKRTVTVEGSTAAQYLIEHRLAFTTVTDIEEAFAQLERKEVDAIVYDAPVLLYYIVTSEHSNLRIASPIFNKETYGIALPLNSSYEDDINRALLILNENGAYERIYNKWFARE